MDEPPEPIASDYVELGTLIVLFLIGGPINLVAYTQVISFFLKIKSNLKFQVKNLN